jgi:hypothetical protein
MCGFQGANGPHPEETIYLALVTVIAHNGAVRDVRKSKAMFGANRPMSTKLR